MTVLTAAYALQLHEKLAYRAIQTVRYIFDRVTGYTEVGMTEQLWLRRIIFLETVAGGLKPERCTGLS